MTEKEIEELVEKVLPITEKTSAQGYYNGYHDAKVKLESALQEGYLIPKEKLLAVDELSVFINEWLSHRHGFSYDGILAFSLAKALHSAQLKKVSLNNS